MFRLTNSTVFSAIKSDGNIGCFLFFFFFLKMAKVVVILTTQTAQIWITGIILCFTFVATYSG